jgi:hypothetical protein
MHGTMLSACSVARLSMNPVQYLQYPIVWLWFRRFTPNATPDRPIVLDLKILNIYKINYYLCSPFIYRFKLF